MSVRLLPDIGRRGFLSSAKNPKTRDGPDAAFNGNVLVASRRMSARPGIGDHHGKEEKNPRRAAQESHEAAPSQGLDERLSARRYGPRNGYRRRARPGQGRPVA